MTRIPLKPERAHAYKNRSHETCKPIEQHIAGCLRCKRAFLNSEALPHVS
jgi:hypothetical protein